MEIVDFLIVFAGYWLGSITSKILRHWYRKVKSKRKNTIPDSKPFTDDIPPGFWDEIFEGFEYEEDGE